MKGKLTKDNLMHAMPSDSPAFNAKPFYFKNAKMYRFAFETDPQAAAEFIPEQLSLVEPASASLMFCEYPWSTIGPYNEAILSVDVDYKGEVFQFMTHLVLDSSEPILVGREYYGFPKKMGVIDFSSEGGVMAGFVERPKGIRLASGVFQAAKPLETPPNGSLLRLLSLRTIPSPEAGVSHSLVELIQTDAVLTPMELWEGSGGCNLFETSVLDPWHRIPVKKMLNATCLVTDVTLPEAKVLERF